METHRVRLETSKKNEEELPHSVHSTPRNRITGMDSKDSGIRIGNKIRAKNTFTVLIPEWLPRKCALMYS